jgi:hypothetical protein
LASKRQREEVQGEERRWEKRREESGGRVGELGLG